MGQRGMASPISKMNDYNEIADNDCWRQRVRGGVTTLDLLLSSAGIGRTGIVRIGNVQIRFIAFCQAFYLRVLSAGFIRA
jgi:hypothetical protein